MSGDNGLHVYFYTFEILHGCIKSFKVPLQLFVMALWRVEAALKKPAMALWEGEGALKLFAMAL